MRIQEIGIVRSPIKASSDPAVFQGVESMIHIHDAFADGLYRIEENSYIVVIFEFHQSPEPEALKLTTRFGDFKGTFASRSPRRPSSIGVTTVKLLERNGQDLRVLGLDAIDGTPVLDLKPYSPTLDDHEREIVKSQRHKMNPRADVTRMILDRDFEGLLSAAGTLHGHFCTGLALGLHLAIRGMTEIRKFSDGIMEDLLAIVEMNNCAADGVQFITGSTFGNNALIYRDFGKNAITLALRDGRGVRVMVKPNWREDTPNNPELTALFQKVVRDRSGTDEDKARLKVLSTEASFELMKVPSDKIVSIEQVTVEIPPYAPIHESFTCAKCGELTMGSRKVEIEGKDLCLKCGRAPFFELSGHGMHIVEK